MKNCPIPFCTSIPDSWKAVPNKYLFASHSIKVGDNFGNYQLLSLTTSGVKTKDINSGGGKVPDNYSNYQSVEQGDIIFCLFDLDCSAVFSGLSNLNGMITSAYDVLRPIVTVFDQTYADYWFKYVFSNRYYKMFSKNIRYTITSEMFGSIFTPIPPINEQSEIGKFLNKKCFEINSLMEIENKQIEKLKEYKNALIRNVITKGLNNISFKPSGIEWIGVIPNSWKVNKLLRLASNAKYSIVDGPFGSDMKNEEYVDDGVPIVQLTNIRPFKHNINNLKFITEEKHQELSSHTALAGDLVIAKMMPAGRTCILSDSFPEYTLAADAVRFVCDDKKLSKRFLMYCMNTYGLVACELLSKGTTRVRINLDIIKNLRIALPDLDEQLNIVSYLDKKTSYIDDLVALKTKKIELLMSYKESLIYECVTGKKEVKA